MKFFLSLMILLTMSLYARVDTYLQFSSHLNCRVSNNTSVPVNITNIIYEIQGALGSFTDSKPCVHDCYILPNSFVIFNGPQNHPAIYGTSYCMVRYN